MMRWGRQPYCGRSLTIRKIWISIQNSHLLYFTFLSLSFHVLQNGNVMNHINEFSWGINEEIHLEASHTLQVFNTHFTPPHCALSQVCETGLSTEE